MAASKDFNGRFRSRCQEWVDSSISLDLKRMAPSRLGMRSVSRLPLAITDGRTRPVEVRGHLTLLHDQIAVKAISNIPRREYLCALVIDPRPHYCPVYVADCGEKVFRDMALRLILLGADLNVIAGYGDASGYRQPGGSHVRRQDAVRPDHGLRAVDQLSSHRHALWRRSPGACAQLRGAVPGPGLCSADVAREPARHRSLPVGAGEQALSHGVARSGSPLHAGRCQRGARLADLARLGTTAHSPGTSPLCRGEPCRRLGQHRLRARFDHHRSVLVAVSVGALSLRPRPR